MPIPTTFEALVKVSVSCGYILTRHDDSHLIAIPWTEAACPDHELIEKFFGEGDHFVCGEASKKLHGRKVWHINLGDDLFVDVSVMPRIATEKQRQVKRQFLVARNQAMYEDYVQHNLSFEELSLKYDLSAFHIGGIIDQLRMARAREDANEKRIRPGPDPYKRRVKNKRGHEPGYVLVYPLKHPLMPAQVPHTTPPVWTYREAQKEADRLNAGNKQSK